jgi:2-dehydropantoate 2-reductase
MRIAVMGTGGVGGYFGGRLAAAGQDVTFIARGAHLEALRRHGLQITSALGDATIAPAQATDDPASVGPVDLVLFTVKLYDTEAAANAIRPLIGPDTGIVTFQNGVTSTEVLAQKLGAEHVIGGVAKIAAVVVEPGVIRNTGTFAELIFGELDGSPSARVAALATALAAAGVKHTVSDDIRRDIWDKMVFLSTFAGVTSLLRLPIGPIRSDRETRCLLHDGLAEASAVALAEDVGLPKDAADRILELIDGLPYEGKSTMLHDLEGGRRLEVGWLSGTIARLGHEHGVATPTHELIARALKLHADGRQ